MKERQYIVTFTIIEVEGTSTDSIQMNILLDKAEDEHQGNGSVSEVALKEPAKEPSWTDFKNPTWSPCLSFPSLPPLV